MRDLFLPLICSLLLTPLALGADAKGTPASPSIPIPTAAHFVPVGPVPGVSGYAAAMAQDSKGVLYVGCGVAAGGTKIVGVARWDGSNWSALGSLPVAELLGVTALTVAPGGELYAAVLERLPNFSGVFHVFRWNGTSWTKLLSSSAGFTSLAHDSAGRLYLGVDDYTFQGALPASVMMWDGIAWTPMSGAPKGSVMTLLCDADRLLVGGEFFEPGGQPAPRVVHWDGELWHSFGGLDGWARSLAKGPDGKIYAAYYANHLGKGGVAVWDGQQWSPMEAGIGPESRVEVRAVSVGPAGQIVMGGRDLLYAGDVSLTVAQWDGTRWQPLCHGPLGSANLGTGFSGPISSLTWDLAGRLIVAGRLDESGVGAKGVAIFENGHFRPLSAGVPYARKVIPDRQGGVYLLGDFAWVDGRHAGGVAHWDGLRWSTLEGGLTYHSANGIEPGRVDAICAPDGKLYVNGAFTHGGGKPLTRGAIACWDGQTWSSLSQVPEGYVSLLGLAPDGSLLAWNYQSPSSGDGVYRLLRWNGTNWSTFREIGTGGTYYYHPSSIISSGARLLVTYHTFQLGGGSLTPHLLYWEGGNWSEIGGGIEGYISAVSGDTIGNFYVCGNFTHLGPVAAGGVARWDGTAWTRIGSSQSFGSPFLSASPDGSIVADGPSFWDGQSWTYLAGFLNIYSSADDAALDAQGNRWICGDIDLVTGQVSSTLFRLLRQPAVATQFTSAVPSATVVLGVPFSHTFTGTGNPLPQFGLGSGSLPPGLTLTNAGVLSGTPTGGAGQIFQAAVRAANGVSGEATQSFSIRVVTRLTSFLESYGLEGGALAATSDPDGDGLSNLLEYAFLLNPTVASQPPAVTSSILDLSGQRYASLRFPRSPAATDLNYIVEATGALGDGPWSEVARSEAGNPCTGPGFVQESAAGDGIDVTVRDTVAIESGAPQRFLRVRVVLAPTR